MLPYGTGICCYAFMVLFFLLLLLSIPLIYSKKSTEWSTIPACPNLMCFFFFFNRGDTVGLNSFKLFYSMFVHVLFYVNLYQD